VSGFVAILVDLNEDRIMRRIYPILGCMVQVSV
jgi:hypothetical protein